MSRSKVVVGGALVAVLALQAGVAFAKPLSPKEWKTQGNAICEAANEQIAVIEEEVFSAIPEGQEPTLEQLRLFVGPVLEIIQPALGELYELEVPKKYRKSFLKFGKVTSETLGVVSADPTVLLGDEDPFKEANALAKKAGLKACAE